MDPIPGTEITYAPEDDSPPTEYARKALSRTDIFAVPDILTEWVDVPEWKGGVWVKGLTAAERDAYSDDCMVGKGKNKDWSILGAQAKLVVRSAVDEHGKRIFSNRDAEVLGEKSASAVMRIFNVAARLSGVTEADLEELGGNSEPSPNGASPTA